MDELAVMRAVMLADTADDEALVAMRAALAVATWDAPDAADGPGFVPTWTPASGRIDRDRRHHAGARTRRAIVVVLAAAMVLVAVPVVGSFNRTRAISTGASVDPGTPGDAASVDAALPDLLDAEWKLRWPHIAWDESEHAKAAFQTTQLATIDREVPRIFVNEKTATERPWYIGVAIQALTTPRPVIDDAHVDATDVGDITIEGTKATAHVAYRQWVHVERDPHAPGQGFSFVVDERGWHTPPAPTQATVELGWEDGRWKLVAIYEKSWG